LTKIFISHAGTDTDQAKKISLILSSAGLEPVLDRDEVIAGDSFLTFMEQALTECRYCLLLWSIAASRRKWVQIEWEAALYRSVTEARAFLMVGRLEDHQLPSLLAARRMVDLFPEPQPGLDELLGIFRSDNKAEEQSQKPVTSTTFSSESDIRGKTIYVTSELFARTVPLCVSFTVPVGIHVDRVVNAMKLPRRFDYEGRIGCNLNYRLARENKVLNRSLSLEVQQIQPEEVLWLEVEMIPFAASTPLKGALSPAVFRQPAQQKQQPNLVRLVRQELLTAITTAGMGE
jgi:hypothetical protein